MASSCPAAGGRPPRAGTRQGDRPGPIALTPRPPPPSIPPSARAEATGGAVQRADLVLGWISLTGGSVALLAVAWTAQWVSVGTLLGAVMLVNAAARLRLAREDAASPGSGAASDDRSPPAAR